MGPVKFNGAVMDNTSIFRADPSPEVDAAWDLLSAEGFEIITVSSDAISLSGHDPRLGVKAPASWFVPDSGRPRSVHHQSSTDENGAQYIAQIDVFHQIHCLDQLRRQINYDYYYGDKWGDNPPPQHMSHVKHCIHILLQNLMCHADVDIVPHNWVHYPDLHQKGRPYAEPLADFSIVKQCRDFEELLSWAKQNVVPDLAHK
ncbi:uncharacterized protein Z518_11300 [Rhinocladiella mackenziei CBS 650.93]|uniref:Uncharacterized protein n=1 Tax=Rhinocladiella mackenziei CBS 650.93 TaxID=1442369 RepID=A0A0D2FBU0_9EURO|nr:uncharacterized protein Z518_11300 [Rhinocladiella mackenziei CBS 650.93]KIW99561.1 hypothetical protein Z518_11300 [Rhinocladiella mackenziei CBS 650.93]